MRGRGRSFPRKKHKTRSYPYNRVAVSPRGFFIYITEFCLAALLLPSLPLSWPLTGFHLRRERERERDPSIEKIDAPTLTFSPSCEAQRDQTRLQGRVFAPRAFRKWFPKNIGYDRRQFTRVRSPLEESSRRGQDEGGETSERELFIFMDFHSFLFPARFSDSSRGYFQRASSEIPVFRLFFFRFSRPIFPALLRFLQESRSRRQTPRRTWYALILYFGPAIFAYL